MREPDGRTMIAELTQEPSPELTADESSLSADARAVFDALPDPAIVVDAEGTVAYANTVALEHFGKLRVEAPLSFAMRKPELMRAMDLVSRTRRSERAKWSETAPINRWYEAYLTPLNLPDAAPGLIAIIVRDLTEQRRLDKMRKDFVSNASHELRTPLSVLLGFIETLQGPARNDEASRDKFLGIMREQAERMRRLTDALLSLSRVEMRAHVRPTDVVDFADVARYAVEMTRTLADEYDVKLQVENGTQALPVLGDYDELVQVVENIIENAIKYGGDGGRVVIRCCIDGAGIGAPQACVAVQDFGDGVSPEHVPRLTERFYRVDVQRSREKRGTGLGLAIAKHIIARHRGRLAVRSEVGQGSTFAVRIPLHPADAARLDQNLSV